MTRVNRWRSWWPPLFALAAMLAVAAPAALANLTLTPEIRQAMATIRPAQLRAHVRFLADDLLEGRDTHGTGIQIAARYLASQFEQFGLEPAGDNGTYFQNVPFVATTVDSERSSFTLRTGAGERSFRNGSEWVIEFPVEGERTAGLVFAGYGIVAPEFRHDDYAGIEVRDRFVVVFDGEPPSTDPNVFDGERPSVHSSLFRKMGRAAERGAAGLIVLQRPGAPAMVAPRRPRIALAGEEARPGRQPAIAVARIQPEAVGAFLAGQPIALPALLEADRRGALPRMLLAGEATLRIAMARSEFTSPNVVAMRPGSDPALKHQVVIFTAHYDHVGLGAPVAGDGIYNGAWDNASGTAEVLEVARAVAALPQAPRRTVMFLLVTGEEHGLLGSRYYVRNPRFPLKDTAANLNLDMTEIFGVGKQIVAQGAERSTLIESVRAVAAARGLEIGEDPSADYIGNVFNRSDQASFARAGVPCLFLRWSGTHEGLTPDESKRRGQEAYRTIYHRPADQFDPDWSWEGMAHHAQTAFLLGLHIANRDDMPAWNPGDEFARIMRN